MFFPILLALVAASGHSVAVPARAFALADTVPWNDTTQVLLTPDNVRRTIRVLTELNRRQYVPKDSLKAHVVLVQPVLGRVEGIPADSMAALRAAVTLPMGNTAEIAKRVPKFAASLRRSRLTPADYTRVKVAWISAYLTNQIDRMAHGGKMTDAAHFGVTGGESGPVDMDTAVGKNVVFLRTHPALADSMRAAIFDLPAPAPAPAPARGARAARR